MCDGARGGIVWAFILWHEVWRHDTIRYGEIYDISVSNESNHITFGKPRHAQRVIAHSSSKREAKLQRNAYAHGDRTPDDVVTGISSKSHLVRWRRPRRPVGVARRFGPCDFSRARVVIVRTLPLCVEFGRPSFREVILFWRWSRLFHLSLWL